MIRQNKLTLYTMNKLINRYEVPKCTSVEFEVGGAILIASGLNQDKFTLDNYDELKNVEW